MILIGLTGSIASGKSACSKRFANTEGVTVIDCDQLVHELQRPGSDAVKAIKKAFPTCVDDKLVLDRAALGQIVFADASKRRVLSGIMNKFIFMAIIQRIITLWATKPRDHITILDAPTLYETGTFVHIVSSVIVVGCPEDVQLKRLMARNNYTREESLQRMRSQISNDEKKFRANFVIDNSEDGEDKLDQKVADAVSWIRSTQGSYKVPMMVAGLVTTIALAAYTMVAVPLYVGRLVTGSA